MGCRRGNKVEFSEMGKGFFGWGEGGGSRRKSREVAKVKFCKGVCCL